MITKMIGIKKFRENITTIWKEARKKKIRYIVLYHDTPIFEVNPIDEEDITFENLASEIHEAREQVKRGEVYTQDEIYKALGL
ncbi:MAG: hypothetical protein ACD_28C00011G0005 [uncultured bacterium]|nr:MAG: hypothetical protein ACD_28C00011G0005 [uncultured bacterium]KKT77209.1 MAG: hypothetical protein UW70_C0001G0007 [Candidatus Peregrinibacteria bacterium GW2011_GWA2_44_7]